MTTADVSARSRSYSRRHLPQRRCMGSVNVRAGTEPPDVVRRGERHLIVGESAGPAGFAFFAKMPSLGYRRIVQGPTFRHDTSL